VIDELTVSQVSSPLICSNFCRKLRLKPGVDPFFVKRQLDWLYHSGHTDSFQTSTTNIRNLQVADFLAGTQIMVPGQDVQEQLTAILDATEGKRASSISHLAAARLAIERFRQAVLSAACSGLLTDSWRSTNPAEGSAQSIVMAVDKARRDRLGRRYKPSNPPKAGPELPDGWCWTTVGALVEVATGATPLRKRTEFYNGTIPWVTSGAVNAGLIIDAPEFITDRAIRETNAKVFPAGTLLVAMYGEGQTRGRVGELAIDAATNQAVAALLFDKDNERLKPYLKTFFLENYERIRALSFGGVQPNLSLGAIRETAFPLPPWSEQAEIVRRVNSLLDIASSLGQRIESAGRRVNHSEWAVLAKAFRGELITTTAGEP
jgi:type I restriction enzyme S subunit